MAKKQERERPLCSVRGCNGAFSFWCLEVWLTPNIKKGSSYNGFKVNIKKKNVLLFSKTRFRVKSAATAHSLWWRTWMNATNHMQICIFLLFLIIWGKWLNALLCPCKVFRGDMGVSYYKMNIYATFYIKVSESCHADSAEKERWV